MGVERVFGSSLRHAKPSNGHFSAAFPYCVLLTRKLAVPTQGVLEGMEDQEGMGELAMCSIHSGYWPVD